MTDASWLHQQHGAVGTPMQCVAWDRLVAAPVRATDGRRAAVDPQ